MTSSSGKQPRIRVSSETYLNNGLQTKLIKYDKQKLEIKIASNTPFTDCSHYFHEHIIT